LGNLGPFFVVIAFCCNESTAIATEQAAEAEYLIHILVPVFFYKKWIPAPATFCFAKYDAKVKLARE
jgi:hypothetical protein